MALSFIIARGRATDRQVQFDWKTPVGRVNGVTQYYFVGGDKKW